jgi:hypothetical protein
MPATATRLPRQADARVARAVRDLAADQPVVRCHHLGDAAIDDRQFEPLDAREHRDRQLAGEQLRHLLVGLLALRRRQPIDGEAVVGREDHQLRITKARLQGVLHQPQPDCQRLELAQTAGGLRAALQLLLQRALEQRLGCGCNQRAVGRHGTSVRTKPEREHPCGHDARAGLQRRNSAYTGLRVSSV